MTTYRIGTLDCGTNWKWRVVQGRKVVAIGWRGCKTKASATIRAKRAIEGIQAREDMKNLHV